MRTRGSHRHIILRCTKCVTRPLSDLHWIAIFPSDFFFFSFSLLLLSLLPPHLSLKSLGLLQQFDTHGLHRIGARAMRILRSRGAKGAGVGVPDGMMAGGRVGEGREEFGCVGEMSVSECSENRGGNMEEIR